MKRIRYVAGRSALATTALAVVLSGCSALSPAIIAEPYPASDGTNIDLPGTSVVLRNFLVIGAEKGAAGVVLGALANDGTSPVQVSLQADLGETAQPTQTLITVGPKSSVQLGPDQQFEMTIPELPVEPGATTSFTAQTTAGGKTELTVPVLRPQDEYMDVTPARPPRSPPPRRRDPDQEGQGRRQRRRRGEELGRGDVAGRRADGVGRHQLTSSTNAWSVPRRVGPRAGLLLTRS